MQQRISRRMSFMAVAVLMVVYRAQAQTKGGVPAEFKPTIDQKFEARSEPAKVTTEDESGLTSKGYVRIGTVTASQPGKKADPGITQQLQSAILQKAAEAGGDVVRFSKEGKIETTYVPTGKTKKECTEHENAPATGRTIDTTKYNTSCYYDVHGFQHCNTTLSTVPGHPTGGGVRCTKWEQVPITRTEKAPVSDGSVWRYDPKPVADIARAAAAPAATAFRILGTRINMLGKDINTTEMMIWLSGLGTPEISRYSDCYYYNFKPGGLSLLFNTEDRLQTIFFYSEGVDGYRQYQGNLPFGLSFQLTRKEIESVLGRPDSSGGNGAVNYWTHYDLRRIGITYNTKRAGDLDARMENLSVSAVH